MADDSFNGSSQRFWAWLAARGIRVNDKIRSADLRAQGRGRGVVACGNIAEDEVLFSIPRDTVLSQTSSNLQSTIGEVLPRASLLAMPGWLALTCILLSESQRSDSQWAPYLDLLPTTLNSLIFWSDTELSALQTSTITHKVGRASAEDLFREHIEPLGIPGYSIEACHRWASLIMAYAFDIPDQSEDSTPPPEASEDGFVEDGGEDEKSTLSMIPLADMLNADGDKCNARLSCDHDDLEMRAVRAISEGEEIFNDYGQLPSADLLRRYGYVTDQYAKYDVAELPLELVMSVLKKEFVTSDGELEARLDLAEKEGLLEDSYDLSHANDDDACIPDELLAVIWFLTSGKATADTIRTGAMKLPSKRTHLATAEAGNILTTAITQRLQSYGTTIEEDQALLTDASISTRTRLAIQVRLGEKHVLVEAAKEAESFSHTHSSTHHGPAQPAEDDARPAKKARHR